MNTSSLLIQLPQADDFRLLIFPAVMLMYYLICWLLVGRDPKVENVTAQYDAPPGISPGVARYILTGGSDGTTLAAILANLAAKQVISLQPEGRSYRIKLLNDQATLIPEEAVVLKSLFHVEMPVEAYAATRIKRSNDSVAQQPSSVANTPEQPQPSTEAVLNPAAGVEIKSILDAIQSVFRDNLQGVYFRWNFGFVLAGILATFVFAIAIASRLQLPQGSPLFATFWLLFFTSVAGLVIAGVWISRPARPTPAQRIQHIALPIVFFLLPGFLIYQFALPTGHAFVLALLILIVLNNVFFVLMRSPTAEGSRILQQLAGFREFLVRVEQDKLERLNTPAGKAEIMDLCLPYAIALNVRESWGDTLAAAFSNAVIER